MASLIGRFNGERLKSARLYNGLTIAEVAEKTGISKQAVSQFENNKSEPKSDTLFKFMGLFGFPREYFFEESREKSIVGDTYFRAYSTLTNKEKLAQIERASMLVEVYKGIEEYISFPKLNLYSIDADCELDMEQLASDVRVYWGISETKPINIIDIMERNGIIVNSFFTNSRNIDAYSQIHHLNGRNIAVVILGEDKENAFRRNFSAAHELGHLLLDDFFSIDDMSKLEYRDMENMMNRFAGALLVPARAFHNDLCTLSKTDINSYISLKKRYIVSAAALIVRAWQLNEITSNQYQYLMKQLSMKGYRTCEPLDKETPPIKPRYLKHAMKIIFEEDGVESFEFLDTLSKNGCTLSTNLIEELVGLEPGYLQQNDKVSNLIELHRKNKDENRSY